VFEKYKKLIEKKVANLKINIVNICNIEINIANIKFISEGNSLKDFENLNRMIKHQFK